MNSAILLGRDDIVAARTGSGAGALPDRSMDSQKMEFGLGRRCLAAHSHSLRYGKNVSSDEVKAISNSSSFQTIF
jgi:hypothetical protein